MPATYNVEVDWGGGTIFSGDYNNISTEYKQIYTQYGRASQLDRAEVGTARISLVDTSGKYVIGNVSSPIVATYGGIYPARPVRIQATLTSTYTIFYGFLDDVKADPSIKKKNAMLACVDGMDQLQKAKINTQLHENVYAGGDFSGMIWVALDEAGWSSGQRVIDQGQIDEYPLIYAEGNSALEFINNIEKSEQGFFYIDQDGKANWEDRYYRLSNNRCISTNWVCTHNDHVNIIPTTSLKDIKNRAIITSQPKTKAASEQDIWTLQDNAANSSSPAVYVGQTQTYWAQYAASGQPIGNIATEVQNVASGDYAGNSAVNGSGDVLTSQIETSTTIFAKTAKIDVYNAGPDDLYLTQLRIRGKMYTDDPPLQIIADNTSSQLAYGLRDMSIELPYYTMAAVMKRQGTNILAAKSEPVAAYDIELVNKNDTILTQILARRVSDRISLQNDDYNISGDFYIEKIRHEIKNPLHRCIWTVTEADPQMYWIWDVSRWDQTTKWAA